MKDRLSKTEIGKDAVQSTAEAAASVVGEVTTIVTSAVKDVASAVGGFATELFEIREAAHRATAEQQELAADQVDEVTDNDKPEAPPLS